MKQIDKLEMHILEHSIYVLELKAKSALLGDDTNMHSFYMKESELLSSDRGRIVSQLESQGHDYFTVTAEMARIRAEVRGEK